jgi:hypothetical protein
LVKLVSIFSSLWITTFTSDSPVLAIPRFALAPNRLMLAVALSPHRFKAIPMDAATLSQTHLIQSGRALRAEPQVKSSFREFLQLHMRLRVAPKSSSPTMRGVVTKGGTLRCMSRRSVS